MDTRISRIRQMGYLSEHLSPGEERAVEVFVRRLLAEFGQDVTDVRLFGSKARGEAGLDSDVDILVLVKRPDYTLKHAILWLAAEISLTYNALLSPRVVPPAAWQKMSQANTLFYRTVCTEGISLLTPTQMTAPAAKTLMGSLLLTFHVSRFTLYVSRPCAMRCAYGALS